VVVRRTMMIYPFDSLLTAHRRDLSDAWPTFCTSWARADV
jgi:hypothetical protein